jgi:hypothetical protein
VKQLLKGPLIVGAVVVIARALIERTGGPLWLSNVVSSVALICVLAPVYFALKISRDRLPRPYSTHFKATALYAILVRAMILPFYWAAFFYGWGDPRFEVPPDSGPFVGYVAIPFLTAAGWIVAAVIVGGGIGSLIIAVSRPSSLAATK